MANIDPTAVTAVAGAAGSGQATVSWTQPVSGAPLTYSIRLINPSTGFGAIIGKYPGNAVSQTVFGLTPGETVQFIVQTNYGGSSVASTSFLVPTGAAPVNAPSYTTDSSGNVTGLLGQVGGVPNSTISIGGGSGAAIQSSGGVALVVGDVLKAGASTTGTPGSGSSVIGFLAANSAGAYVGNFIPRTGSLTTFNSTVGNAGEIGSINSTGGPALYQFTGGVAGGTAFLPSQLNYYTPTTGSVRALVANDSSGAIPSTIYAGVLDFQLNRAFPTSGSGVEYSTQIGNNNYIVLGALGAAFTVNTLPALPVGYLLGNNQIIAYNASATTPSQPNTSVLIGTSNTDNFVGFLTPTGTATATLGGNTLIGNSNSNKGSNSSTLVGNQNTYNPTLTAIASGAFPLSSCQAFGAGNTVTSTAFSGSTSQTVYGSAYNQIGSYNTFSGPLDIYSAVGTSNTATSVITTAVVENVAQFGHGMSVTKLANTTRIGHGFASGANSYIAGIDISSVAAANGTITIGINSAAAAGGVLAGPQNGTVESGRTAAAHTQIGGSFGLRAKQIKTTVAGADTVTVQPNVSRLRITGTAAVTSEAITLPTSPVEGQILAINNANTLTLTTVTFAGGTVTNSATVAALLAPVNGHIVLSYDSTAGVWDQIA